MAGKLLKFNFGAGKHVVIVGGGDTGSDCLEPARQHAASSPKSKSCRGRRKTVPIPRRGPWPWLLRTSQANHEGGRSLWNIQVRNLSEPPMTGYRVAGHDVQWNFRRPANARFIRRGSDRVLRADLVLIAMGLRE